MKLVAFLFPFLLLLGCSGPLKFSTASNIAGNSTPLTGWAIQLGAVTTYNGGSNVGDERVWDVARDSDGNIFVQGDTAGALGEANGGQSDIFVAKFNSTGTLQWINQLGAVSYPAGSTTWDYEGFDPKVDSSGNVYFVGGTEGNLGETNAGNSDNLVGKMDTDGTLLWLKQFGTETVATGGDNAGGESFNALALDDDGNLFLVGNSNGAIAEANAGSYDLFLVKMYSDGTF